jgi:hypothetical protein
VRWWRRRRRRRELVVVVVVVVVDVHQEATKIQKQKQVCDK